MDIRKANPADIPVLLRLLTQMALETGATTGSTEQSLMDHGFGPQPRFHALMAFGTNMAQAMIIYFPEYSTWRGEIGLFVQDVYVAPQARGQGLGRLLLQKALEMADWSPKFLTLMVANENTAAHRFYAGLGMTLRDHASQLILEGEGLAALREK